MSFIDTYWYSSVFLDFYWYSLIFIDIHRFLLIFIDMYWSWTYTVNWSTNWRVNWQNLGMGPGREEACPVSCQPWKLSYGMAIFLFTMEEYIYIYIYRGCCFFFMVDKKPWKVFTFLSLAKDVPYCKLTDPANHYLLVETNPPARISARVYVFFLDIGQSS